MLPTVLAVDSCTRLLVLAFMPESSRDPDCRGREPQVWLDDIGWRREGSRFDPAR